MTENPLHDQVVQSLNERFYSQPLIDNVYRGDYVETLILFALGEGWKPVGGWGSWDLEKGNGGVRLEVKQSAAKQPVQPHYKQSDSPQSSPPFRIEPKTYYYTNSTDAAVRVDLPKGERVRPADIYIFAWHPETDSATADHRQPEQWEFYVVPEHRLPDQKSISLNPLKNLAAAVTYAELAAKVTAVADGIPREELKAHQLR